MPRGLTLAVGIGLSLLSGAVTLGNEAPTRRCHSIAGTAWRTYPSEHGGFRVDVPTTWSIEVRRDAAGVLVTLLTPPDGPAVAVTSQADSSLEPGDADLPNTRCMAVRVGDRLARRCFDSISGSVSTTIRGAGKTHVITIDRRRGDQCVYDRILTSFRVGQ